MTAHSNVATLPGMEPPLEKRFIGQTETKVEEELGKLRSEREFTPGDEMIAEVARALSQNIDRGNLKGRAIGNEAAQLLACLEQLRGESAEPVDETDIPDETRRFMDGLRSVPRPDRATPGDDAA